MRINSNSNLATTVCQSVVDNVRVFYLQTMHPKLARVIEIPFPGMGKRVVAVSEVVGRLDFTFTSILCM